MRPQAPSSPPPPPPPPPARTCVVCMRMPSSGTCGAQSLKAGSKKLLHCAPGAGGCEKGAHSALPLANEDGRRQRGRECTGLLARERRVRRADIRHALLGRGVERHNHAGRALEAVHGHRRHLHDHDIPLGLHCKRCAVSGRRRALIGVGRLGAMPELPFRLLGRTKLPLSAGDRTPELMMSPQQATCAGSISARACARMGATRHQAFPRHWLVLSLSV
jgi:hypothetical protein